MNRKLITEDETIIFNHLLQELGQEKYAREFVGWSEKTATSIRRLIWGDRKPKDIRTFYLTERL